MFKCCGKCKQNLPIDQFHKYQKSKDGLVKNCKECAKKVTNEWRKANLAKAAAQQTKWRNTHPELSEQYRLAWYENNKEQHLQNAKAWRLANPNKRRSYCAKRRATLLQATPKWLTTEHWNQINDIYTEATKLNMVVDHDIPLVHKYVCGLHVPNNLQLLTQSENCKKSNKFQVLTY